MAQKLKREIQKGFLNHDSSFLTYIHITGNSSKGAASALTF